MTNFWFCVKINNQQADSHRMMNSLFQWTGHPFADNGLAFMLSHCEKANPEDLDAADAVTMSALLSSVYLGGGWLKAMQNIFPNGALTNPAFSKNRAMPWGNVLLFLTQNLKPSQSSGSCICCGTRDAVRISPQQKKQFPNDMIFNKVYIPLVGGIPNFFPGGVMGADFCANCVFLIQCAPLAFYTANCDEKRFLLVHSNSPKVMTRWSKRANHALEEQQTMGEMTGPFNEDYRNATNAFFHIVESVLGELDLEERDKYTTVSLYHFDNYNQPKSTPLKIYAMPAPVFRFLLEVANSPLYGSWKTVVGRNYFFVNKDRTPIPLSLQEGDEKRKFTRNLVFENLIAGKSISSRFLSKRQRLVYAPWELLALYLKEVRSMTNERLDTIKRVADDIALVIRNGKKARIADLESAKSYASFRNVLLRCIKDRLRADAALPLFSLDEYVEQLFPEGAASWRETQDLLLFRLYEQLHDFLKKEGVPQTDIDKENPELDSDNETDPELVTA